MPLTERLDRWNAALVARPGPLFVVAAIVLLVQVGPWWYATPDSAAYLSIARSVWHGRGMLSLGSPHLFYSPAYPLLLSPAFAFGERPFIAAGMLNWLLSLLLLVGVYRWAKPLGGWYALGATLLTLLHAQFGIHFRRPLSEVFFMAALVWTVIALNRVRTAESRGERVRFGLAGTALLTLTCLIRPNGLMLIPGLGLALAVTWGWQDRRRLAAAALTTLLIGGVAAGAFFVVRRIDDRRAAATSAPTYWDYLVKLQDPTKPTMFARIPDGLLIQTGDFHRLIVPGMFKARSSTGKFLNINTLVAALLTIVVVAGWIRLARRSGELWIWSLPFFLGLNVLWAADAGARYSLPTLPAIWVCVGAAVERWRPRADRWLLPLIVAHGAVGVVYWASVELPRARELNAHWPAVAELSSRIDRDRETVAAEQGEGLPKEERKKKLSLEQAQLFRFQLDRDVKTYTAERAAGERFTWILRLVDDDSTLPAGYAPGPTAAPYRLLLRQ